MRDATFIFMTIGTFIIILDEKNRVLLAKRRDKDLWNLPGGRVEEGESPWQAAVRETHEELGVTIKIEKIAGVYFKKEKNEIVFQFIGYIESGTLQTSDEAEAFRFFGEQELPQNTAPKQRERIFNYLRNPAKVALKEQ